MRSLELAPGVWITRTRSWVSIARLETNGDIPEPNGIEAREALGDLHLPDWHAWALCAGMSLADFFGTVSGERPTMKRSEVTAARRTCGACPVVRECLDSALSKPEWRGVWGGHQRPAARQDVAGHRRRPAPSRGHRNLVAVMAGPVTKPAARRAPRKAAAKRAPRTLVAKPEPDADLALRLHLKGTRWTEIATQAGYESPLTARLGVQRYTTRAAIARDAEQREGALQVAIERYEAVLRAWWDKGTGPRKDAFAAGIVLKTLAELVKLQQLAEPAAVQVRQTIILGGDSKSYVARLKELTGVVDAEVVDNPE